MGGNPDDLVATESGEADGTGSVGDEVLSQMVRNSRSPYLAVLLTKKVATYGTIPP